MKLLFTSLWREASVESNLSVFNLCATEDAVKCLAAEKEERYRRAMFLRCKGHFFCDVILRIHVWKQEQELWRC